MSNFVDRGALRVDRSLAAFIEDEVLVDVAVDQAEFWTGFGALVRDLAPKNRALVAKRDTLQDQIDQWHRANPGPIADMAAYQTFLGQIGYLVPDDGFAPIRTTNVDPEIALMSGPQLVVPVTNARFALNAANARWGSLYDALYGTDALGSPPPSGDYDEARGARVVAWAKDFLDEIAPLATGTHRDATGYTVTDAALLVGGVPLRHASQFAGFTGDADSPSRIYLVHHGLHVEIVIDAKTRIGANDPAHVSDIRLESALTAIVDCEDSVACVDSSDKIGAYRNWLGLMTGHLTASVAKDGATFTRRLNPDLTLVRPDRRAATLPARALMLVRNVGHLMTTPAVQYDNADIPETLLDAVVTVACAMHDLQGDGAGRNSRVGSVYVVIPKTHGPEEVALSCEIFDRVEDLLGLPRHTVKLGIMDEERRTSANLIACIAAAQDRVAFINTGFLDRTGDEIYTAMEAGPMVRKAEMKHTDWIAAYEDRNVDIGLACGLAGVAQIGKGMWAMPDRMAEMLETKIAHPQAGASTAWVPSPTAATLHATHYHRVDVRARQAQIAAEGPRATLDQLLTLPLAVDPDWSAEDITAEVENNAQGILGYVVRWVDQGIGCSTVPDIDDIGLMEDRATCRISSLALANWLHHGIVSEDDVQMALQRMARKVDAQNADDPLYRPMAPDFDGPAFRAAQELIFAGRKAPSGYTEPALHAWRAKAKSDAGTP